MLFRGATLLAVVLAAVASAGVGASVRSPNHAASSQWTIGPIIRGRNYSREMPLHPSPSARGAFSIELPQAPGSVHYVTFPHGSLAGKTRIVMHYSIQADRGVRIVPRGYPEWTAKITPYFQRRGDNWTGRGRFETYRWYATFASKEVVPGQHRIVVPLNGNWTAVETSNARKSPGPFGEALAEADQVGFVLGGGDGYGHGAYATGRARLVVTHFSVE